MKPPPGSQETLPIDAKQAVLIGRTWLPGGTGRSMPVTVRDAEIFTKTATLASMGTGASVGLHPASTWSNPEPEIVLAIDSRARIVGTTLGNDVNLRDFEGCSALLLGKARDNNGSCAIGPFIRLFDAHYSLTDVRSAVVRLRE